MFYAPDIVIFLAIILMASGICGMFYRKRTALFLINTLIFLAIVLISGFLLFSQTNTIVFGIFHVFPFSVFFLTLFTAAIMLVNTLSYKYSKNFDVLSMLISLSYFGMVCVVSSVSFIAMVVGLEIISLTTAFMILVDGKRRIESAIKLFILGAIAIATITFALAILFAYDPSLSIPISSYPVILNISGNPYFLVLALLLFGVGISFEASLFPFNLWVPDVYTGAPTYITALMAGINKKVAFAAIILIFFAFAVNYSKIFSLLFLLLSVFTMFFGNIMASVQKNVKRLFAYSSISQAGYITIGIAVATSFGIEASIFQIVAHVFMIIGAFTIVLWLEFKEINTIEDYEGLYYRNRYSAIALTILMLSMAGIPPLMGFYGKFLLFSSAVEGNMMLLAIIGILNSFISIYYYGKLMNSIYTKKEHKALFVDRFTLLVITLCVAFVIIFGIYPTPVMDAAGIAVKSILF
jgi:NADH-quinone oxidoreductase subunit N